MVIPIIGAPSPKAELDRPQIALPGPEEAAAASYLVSPERLEQLLGAEDVMLRGWAIEQLVARPDAGLDARAAEALADEDPYVFSEAVHLAMERPNDTARARAKDLFKEAEGRRAGMLATLLSRIEPEALAPAVREKGRIDDDAFPAVAAGLAVAGGPDAQAFFKRSLGRMQMLSPDRRSALQSAVLLSGDEEACARVLGDAIGDSNSEAPASSSFPTRVAVASLADLGIEDSRIGEGARILEPSKKRLAEIAAEALEDEGRALRAALDADELGQAFELLAPIAALELPEPVGDHAELRNLPQRRQGLLRALLKRGKDVAKLEPAAAAIFVALAAQAVGIVVGAAASERESPGWTALSKALGVEPGALELDDVAALTARFEAKTAREMRPVCAITAREPFRRAITLRRVAEAITRAGHGSVLIAAVAENPQEGLHQLIAEGMSGALEDAETAALEVFDAQPLEPAEALLALRVGALIRTERIGLAAAARFWELRALSKTSVAQVLASSGDARLLPLLKARAFPGEPEEAAWVLGCLVAGEPLEGELAEAHARLERGRYGQEAQPLELELRCAECGESGVYGFERAYVDPKASDDLGDPAFVGDVICKACGAQDTLAPDNEGGRILASHMLEYLRSIEAGTPATAVVVPQVTTIGKTKMGISEALRTLGQRIDESPEAIRPRLERARIYLLLRRSALFDDLAAIRAQDAEAVEATVLEASAAAGRGEAPAAVAMLVAAHRRLGETPEPRLYDSASVAALRASVEGLLFELSRQGTPVPSEIDLGPARARQEALEEQIAERAKSRLGRG